MITYSDPGEQTLPFDKEAFASLGLPQIVFTWKRGSGPQIVVKPKFTPQGLTLEGSASDFFPVIWYTSAGDTPEEAAKRFSDLSRDNLAFPAIEALKTEFDFIQDVSIEYFSGVPMLFASVKGIAKKMPLGLVSEGVNRLFSILTGIATYKDGVVLIDQFEDGFYHDRLSSVWKSVHRLASENNTQLFVTTHSEECLKSMLPAVQGNEKDFCLLRAARENGTVAIHRVEGLFLEAALTQGIDMR
jgi:hypothetical protein